MGHRFRIWGDSPVHLAPVRSTRVRVTRVPLTRVRPTLARLALVCCLIFGSIGICSTPARAEFGHALVPLNDGEVAELLEAIDRRLATPDLPDAALRAAIRRLQKLNEDQWGRNHVLRAKERRSHRVSVSVTRTIAEKIRGLDARQVQVYREEFDLAAAALYEAALAERDADELVRCLELYPVASCRDAVAMAASELFIERADFPRARAVLAAVPFDQNAADQNAADRDEASAGEAKQALADLALRWLVVHSKSGDLDGYRLWSERLAEIAPKYPDADLPPPPAAAQVAERFPSLPFGANEGQLEWRSQDYHRDIPRRGEVTPFGPVPHVGDKWIAVVTPQGPASQQVMHRYDRRTGLLLQSHPLPRPKQNRGYEDSDTRSRVHVIAHEDLMIGSYVSYANNDDDFFGYQIKVAVPRRSLRAVEIKNTTRNVTVWDTATSSDPVLKSLSFNSRPQVLGNRVYALGWRWSGYIDCHLVCFEATTGRVMWRTILAGNQIELTMFGEISREPHLGEVLVEDGVVYALSNLGVLAALDAWDGDIRWLTEYDALQVRYNASRTAPKPDFRWERNPIVSSGKRIYVTPLDSHECLAVDKASGAVDLRTRVSDPHYLLGVQNDHLVFCGRHSITLVPLRDFTNRALRTEIALSGVSARPAMVDGGIVYSREDGIFYRSFRGEDDREVPLARFEGRRAQPREVGRRRPGRRHRPRSDGAVHITKDSIVLVSSFNTSCYIKKEEPPEPLRRQPR